MSELFQKYFQLTLLKATPQDLPGHSLVLWISIAVAFLTSVAGFLFAYSFGDAIFRSILAIAVPGILVYAMLGVKDLQARFKQAYSALCGSAAVIYLIALPLLPTFFSAASDTFSGKLVIVAVLLLDLWTVLITAHILKHTFDIGMASGVSLSVVLMLVTVLTIEAIAPTKRLEQTEEDLLSSISSSAASRAEAMIWRSLYRSG